jgi:hypothetical protein
MDHFKYLSARRCTAQLDNRPLLFRESVSTSGVVPGGVSKLRAHCDTGIVLSAVSDVETNVCLSMTSVNWGQHVGVCVCVYTVGRVAQSV